MAPPPIGAPSSERDRICAALLALVAEHGYPALTIGALQDRAAVDATAFNRHFAGLDDCFGAVWQQAEVELHDRMARAFAPRRAWCDRLRAALRAGMEYLSEDEGIARLYVVDVFFAGEEQYERFQKTMERLSQMIDLGRREAADPDRLTASIAEGIAGGIWRRVHRFVREGHSAELPTKVPELMYFVVLPYLGIAAAQEELGRPLE